ncbi:MAG: hypothetical protein KY462_15240 [Actinobacteria bacterium]|nr:hypothetical protein [Actinomycetota bacterium]
MPTVLAVDGNSLAHRAWHALIDERDSGPWLAGGVVRMLGSVWRYGRYAGVVVAFDAPDSIRKARHPGYKASRPTPDPAFVGQLRNLAHLLAACGFTVLSTPGHEADDLLAATVAGAGIADVRTTLVSSDRDLLALVSDRATLLRPRRTMADLAVYDPAAVRAEFGVEPTQYLELAALRGDPSDDLPGVPGVGQRTAARLLRSWGSVGALYAGIRDLPPDLAARLRDSRGDVERNLELMAPLAQAPVDLAATLANGVDLAEVRRVLAPVGLGPAADAFRRAVERGPLPPMPPPPLEPPPGTAAADPPAPRAPLHLDGIQAALFS